MSGLPPTVTIDLREPALAAYFKARVGQALHDSYAGAPLVKFPEDLRVYEHLLWAQAADTVVEVGTYGGGSALWFRDRLRTLQAYGRIERDPLVVSVDVDQADAAGLLAAVGSGQQIRLVEGDVRDASTVAEVRRLIADRTNCFVVEDSAHTYETTLASLEAFADLVPVDGFMVVEDGCVDIEALRLAPDWPRGVLPALHDWLATEAGRAFAVRRDLELYGMACHPEGFLQRRSSAAAG
jgi:cephalosporin hydroxylase